MRQEEDFQHQVVLMTRNAAKQIMNIYERLTVQRTWSASNLLQNMADQQARLAEQHSRQARVVELKFFGDLTFEEIAQLLNVSPTTARADWYFARSWLRRELDR